MKFHRILSTLFLWSALAVLATTARAAGVQVVNSAPTAGVLTINTAKSPLVTVGLKNDGTAAQWQGLTFNVSNSVMLDKIAIAYAKAAKGAAGARVSISIIQLVGNGGGVSNMISRAKVLSTDQFVMPAEMANDGWLVFDLTDIKLSSSDRAYGFIIRFDDEAPWRQIAFIRGNDDIGTRGAISYDGKESRNFVFRSDDGGKNYYNLGTDNLPQFSLLGYITPAP